MTANLREQHFHCLGKDLGSLFGKSLILHISMGKKPLSVIAPLSASFKEHFKVPLVFFLQAHCDILPALFTLLKQVLAVKLPFAALNLCHPQNIHYCCCNTTLYVYTSFNSYFDKYSAGEIFGSARIVALPQTGFQLALYSLTLTNVM